MATPGGGATTADFTVSPLGGSFVSNATAATVTVTAVDDADADYGESVTLGFGTLPSWVTAGTPATATVALHDDDTTPFTDDPISPGTTPLRAVHFHELRARIAGLRARQGLPAVQWTDSTLTAGVTPVKRVHLTELRAALDAVYDAAGRPRPSYTDAAVTAGTTAIKALHVMELRAAVAALE